MTWSACFFIQRRTTCPRGTLSHGVIGPLTSTISQENALASFQVNLMKAVSSTEMTYSCVFQVHANLTKKKKNTRIYKNLSTVCDNLFKIFSSMHFRMQSMVLLTTCLWFIPHVYLYSCTYWRLPLILPSHLPFQVFVNHILLILYHQLSKIMHIKII